MKRSILFILSLVPGVVFAQGTNQNLSRAQTSISGIDIPKRLLLRKEHLEKFGIPTQAQFEDQLGRVRTLLPREILQVETHEEDGSISFSTFDNYSIRIPEAAVQAPRNVSDETGF